MRRILTTICALFIALLFPVSILIAKGLPADTGSYVSKKYAGWNGVLQAWVCCDWDGNSRIISWLKDCADAFERGHNGVYIEFIPVSTNELRSMPAENTRRPEMIFFSSGVMTDANGLAQMNIPDSLRKDLPANEYALPVAMGGYIWVYNRALASGAPARSPDLQLAIPADEDGRDYSPAAIALLSGEAETQNMEMPDAGIDLGLPASAPVNGINADAAAMDRFIAGELPWIIADQDDLARLQRMQERGKGPDWACAPAGDFTWTDRIFYAGLTNQDGHAATERMQLAANFIGMLSADDAQNTLADAGFFAVNGKAIHTAFSVYAEMDAMLAGLPLAAPEPFSEHSRSSGAAIVREYCAGECSAEEAYAKMGLSLTLPNQPI